MASSVPTGAVRRPAGNEACRTRAATPGRPRTRPARSRDGVEEHELRLAARLKVAEGVADAAARAGTAGEGEDVCGSAHGGGDGVRIEDVADARSGRPGRGGAYAVEDEHVGAGRVERGGDVRPQEAVAPPKTTARAPANAVIHTP